MLERQTDGELASAARARALHGDGAAMQLNEAPCDRQTEAETALRPFEDARPLREEIEQARPQVFGDANPIVPDRDQSAAPARSRRDVDGSALFGVLTCVGEQIAHHLNQPMFVAVDAQPVRGHGYS